MTTKYTVTSTRMHVVENHQRANDPFLFRLVNCASLGFPSPDSPWQTHGRVHQSMDSLFSCSSCLFSFFSTCYPSPCLNHKKKRRDPQVTSHALSTSLSDRGFFHFLLSPYPLPSVSSFLSLKLSNGPRSSSRSTPWKPPNISFPELSDPTLSILLFDYWLLSFSPFM